MKNKFYDSCFYHVFNKSIANFGIFSKSINSIRFIDTLDYYNNLNVKLSFSVYLRKNSINSNLLIPKNQSIVKIISYCIMPDHYHMLVKIINASKFSKYLNNVESSFTRYFNLKNNRKGPLWQSTVKSVYIESNEHLLHVSRYIHLNPTTKYLIDKPEDWNLSSYKFFISDKKYLKEYVKEISIDSCADYKKFVENNIDYQRQLKHIGKLTID
ncbi:MAG: transposase [Patescibacteria group bacterium]|jgi:putative transposase